LQLYGALQRGRTLSPPSLLAHKKESGFPLALPPAFYEHRESLYRRLGLDGRVLCRFGVRCGRRGSRGERGKCKPKGTPFAGGAPQRKAGAVFFGDPSRQSQPQARAARGATPRAIDSVESVEHSGLLFWCYADAGILDGETHLTVFTRNANINRAPGLCITDGIIQKNCEQPLQAIDVSTHKRLLGCRFHFEIQKRQLQCRLPLLPNLDG
jgi:hypothetical protein